MTPFVEPACSFCGGQQRRLIRAGGRNFWICAECIRTPVVTEAIEPDTLCTFCRESPHSGPDGNPREVVGARSGAVICADCLTVCVQLLEESERLRSDRPLR